jgi:hypothetical protein
MVPMVPVSMVLRLAIDGHSLSSSTDSWRLDRLSASASALASARRPVASSIILRAAGYFC